MHTVLLAIGSILPLIGGLIYSISILQGKTRPERMSRFLLVVITGLTGVSLWAAGDTSGIWLALTSFIQSLCIWMLCMGKRGIGGTSRLDFICLGLCSVGLACWLLAGDSWFGLAAAILADVIAVTPSLVKTIRLPHTEIMSFYLLDTIAAFAILLAGPLTLAAATFPLYIAVINAVFVGVIFRPYLRPKAAVDLA